MKSLYVTSVEPFSGKTAFCLALGRHLQSKGLSLGYLKPFSTQPWRTPDGQLADEDAVFVDKVLGLGTEPGSLSPVIVTPERLRRRLQDQDISDLLDRIRQAADDIGHDKDVLLMEGGASLREGYAMGLSNPSVAKALGAPVLVIAKYRGEMEIVDDALTARFRLSDQLLGVVLNHVPEEAAEFVSEYVVPYLQGQGIRVLGWLPSRPRLSALSLTELIGMLDARVLTKDVSLDAMAGTFTVGAMNAEAALSRFRRQQNKAVITGGDRTDIQLAALETSTVALILTGNLRPSPLILEQAENLKVPVLLVPTGTMETVEKIERAYGKTRLGQTEKLDMFQDLVIENLDLEPIYQALSVE
ncbi:MAG: phosphotransacetylase family protein [Anaerolineales bacterium]